MQLDAKDHIAMRVAEQAVLRTSANDRPTPRRTHTAGTRIPIELDPARLDALAAAGYLEDADDRDADPSRGRRRLLATESGRIEWRCAAAEDPALAMAMDDVFHVAGTMVKVEVRDVRYHGVDDHQPHLAAPEWEIRHEPADPENDIDEMTSYRRTVEVDAIVNHLGETLTAWNPTEREPVGPGRMPAHSTAARITMSASILVALDAAVSHRLYYQGGHTHYETRCGTRGASASSGARNVLLRFGLVRTSRVDARTRREDFDATPRGIAFHAVAVANADQMTGREAGEWERHLRTVRTAAAA